MSAIHPAVLAAGGSPLSYFQAVVLGLLQGVTELFPVSSLGHTVLFPTLFGWSGLVRAQSRSESFWLAFVVMLHVGSALGLLAYYWREWIAIIAALSAHPGDTARQHANGAPGLADHRREHSHRNPRPRLRASVPHADRKAGDRLDLPRRQRLSVVRRRAGARRAAVRELAVREGAKPDGGRQLDTLEFREAALVGVAQSSALVCGISRDGVCMGTGLARGLDHSDAARFAFLLATPIILAAGLFKLPDLTGPLGNGVRGQALVACVTAAIAALFTVRFLVRWFQTRTLTPFALYCLLFGLAMVIYNS